MRNLRLIFSNINQGLIYTGKDPAGYQQLSAPDNLAHIETLKASVLDVDVVCLAEALLDNENGHSEMINDFKKAFDLKHHISKVNGTCWHDIKNLNNQFYGQAVISRYPLENERYIFIEEPDFIKGGDNFSEKRVNHGSGKFFHNKYLQGTEVLTHLGQFQVVNLHGIPFHKFGKNPYSQVRMTAVREWWGWFEKKLLKAIRTKEKCIITGDFNNSGFSLTEVLPHLINDHGFKFFTLKENKLENTLPWRQLTKGERLYTENTQMDFILLSPDLAFQNIKSIVTPSDHPALYAEIKYKEDDS